MVKTNSSKNEQAIRNLLHELDWCDRDELDDRLFVDLFWVLIKELSHEEFVNILKKIKASA
jgi:hypothetical protein